MTFISGPVHGSMLVKPSSMVVGNTCIVSSLFISETVFGCSILRSFSIGLAISASSPCFYAEEVSDRCADCLSPVGIVFVVN